MEHKSIYKFSVTPSSVNKDLIERTREDYLKTVRDFKSSYQAPVIEEVAGVTVVREDLLECGGKARLGEALIASVKEKTIVYVQPRYGFAAISLVDLCKKYNKKLVLFMPSSKQVSDHQAFTIEHGAEPHFYRVAAMKNLNSIAKLWARQHGGFFIPLGLDHPLVTAMIVKTASEIREPSSFWTAVSTGVLTRGLQIAWPNATAYGVAVSRNIQDGERGSCKVISSYYSFEQDSRDRPPFPSASNYDAKVWEYLIDGDLFWNVAGEVKPTIDKSTIKSERQWQS
jgi:hypothetical protein